MDRKSIEWHETKLRVYKNRKMEYSVAREQAAIDGIKAREKLKNDRDSKGLERLVGSRLEMSCH